MHSLLQYTPDELAHELAALELPGYRRDQLLKWLYGQFVVDFEAMTNLSKALRGQLAERFVIVQGRRSETLHSDDGAMKFLLRWGDDALTETVVMPTDQRCTVCISTQVGCPVRCAFCASGATGLQRDLTAEEIVEQVYWAGHLSDQPISNVVIMGMGEPLANYENTLAAVGRLNADWAFNIGARRITISTIGLPEQIRRLADEPYQVTLAVSLHAGDDELRGRLIPWARKHRLDELFAALAEYYERTHREITLEYVLLDDVNCALHDADRLAHWARRTRCNVNLISYNPVEGKDFQAASAGTTKAFMEQLQRQGVNVHLRRSRGADITAACGQLRRRMLE